MERVGVLNITTCVHMYQVSAGRHDFLIFWRGNVVFPNDSGKNKLSMKIDLSIYFTNYGLKIDILWDLAICLLMSCLRSMKSLQLRCKKLTKISWANKQVRRT